MARSQSGRGTNSRIGLKLIREQSGREAFHQHNEMRRERRAHKNLTSHNKQNDSHLNMFSVLIRYKIARQISDINVITIDLGDRVMKLERKISKPRGLDNGIDNTMTLCLCVKAGYGGFPFKRLENQMVAKKYTTPRGGSASLGNPPQSTTTSWLLITKGDW